LNCMLMLLKRGRRNQRTRHDLCRMMSKSIHCSRAAGRIGRPIQIQSLLGLQYLCFLVVPTYLIESQPDPRIPTNVSQRWQNFCKTCRKTGSILPTSLNPVSKFFDPYIWIIQFLT
jgi:hypothetical protein